MRLAVGVAQGSLQPHAGLITYVLIGLDRESEPAARREHAGDGRRDRGQIAAIDKNIGGKRDVVLRAGFGGKELHQFRDHKAVVQSLGARLLDHAGRNVDADKPVAIGPKRRTAEACAAAKIEHRAQSEPLSFGRP